MDMSWLDGVSRVAVLTGAGISTDSGIPDYRGPNGVWTKDPGLVDAFTLDRFLADPAVRAAFWQTYAGHAAWQAQPSAGHLALAGLERDGVAIRILTQNVDGLHQKAGSSPRKVLELHGSIHETACTGCGVRAPSEPTMARVSAGDLDPRCPDCGAILQLGVVLFGQHLNPETAGLAERIAAHSQLLLVVGSSLLVEPVASLCAVALNAGNRLVIVNRDPTPYDDVATALIREPIGEALPALRGAPAMAATAVNATESGSK